MATTAGAADWHHPFHLPGDGYWRARLPITVHNDSDGALDGASVEVDPPLAGTAAEAVRVCDANGVEMLFALSDANGRRLTAGQVPEDTRLTIPVECPAGESTTLHVYFDNPGAGEVPDFLAPLGRLVNGDVEQGEGEIPDGWAHDRADAEHRACWSDERPQSGRRCLKTVVAAGAKPTWIATRQHGIRLQPGAKYRFRAFVRAENVQGNAGWYIHVGNHQQPMLVAPMLKGGDGTYDWKALETEFTVPPSADRADLGTVLRGTGTAWFDNVALEQLTPGLIRAELGPVERMPLDEFPVASGQQDSSARAWPDRILAEGYARRAVVKSFCFDTQPGGDRLTAVDFKAIEARARGRLDRQSLTVLAGDRQVAPTCLGDTLLLDASIPPQSASMWHVYFRDDRPIDAMSGAAPADRRQAGPAAALIDGPRNLVANASFEQGGPLPDEWTGGRPAPGADGVEFGLDEPGAPGLGNRAARLRVPHDAAKSWRGWRQAVAVKPGRSYLVAGWVKLEDVRRPVQLHAHLLRADGKLCEEGAFRSTGPAIAGTTDWTLMSSVLRMPEDAATLELHLTMDTSGTLWHDGLLVAAMAPAEVVGFECRPMKPTESVAAWQVPAVEKVFPDDPVAAKQNPPAIALAQNERETLQLAVRSGHAVPGVRVEVDPPRGPGGRTLDVEVNVVGLVPVDHPTSYYRSLSPPWHRKVPERRSKCDGWAGPWPDPLLPTDTFDLPANETRAVWITATSEKTTRPGRYTGRVRLTVGNRSLCEREFEVRVWDFALPERTRLAAIYDVRLGRARDLWGGGMETNYRQLVEFLAERRLSADRIWPDPKIDYVDGRVKADFTEFDRAAAWYFDELKLPFSYTPRAFYLFGWAHPPAKKFGEQPYEGEPPWDDVDRAQLRPEYKRAYQACLKAFWDHVRERGWADHFVLYISDEPHYRHEHIRRQMEALCRMIHEVDPAIPIYSSTWGHVPDWDHSLDIWGIGHYGRVPVEQMEKLQQMKRRLWFTTDGQMCLDTPYCGVERLLPYYCFKYGVEAYEFWGAAWLTYDPYRFGWHAYIRQADRPGNYYWVRYPNGDGFLIYPGGPIGHTGPISTVRLEQAREGVEDYEALCLLRERLERARAAGRDVAAAEAALQSAADLVTIPNAGGRYSSLILPDPEAVYRVRREVAAAIDALGSSPAP